uniref:hypothetical protein n=1 Tax=Haliangium sp. TaxID=2663208 RepID=UPI003D0E5BEC
MNRDNDNALSSGQREGGAKGGAKGDAGGHISPGKVTRTSKLSPGAGGVVQRVAAPAGTDAAQPQVKSAWEWTKDPWMDTAVRGAPPPATSS